MTVEIVLFYGFIFIVGVMLYVPVFIVKNKSYSIFFTILSAITFTFMSIQLADYTMLMLVFIGIVIMQFITLIIGLRGEN